MFRFRISSGVFPLLPDVKSLIAKSIIHSKIKNVETRMFLTFISGEHGGSAGV